LQVKRLQPQDAETAAAVVKLFAGKVVSAEYLQGFLANPHNYLLVAEADNRLAGFLLAHALQRLKQDSYKMFIYEIEVSEDFRRQGIGAALINHIREIVRQENLMNAFVLTNYSNQGAVEFYKSTGGKIANGDDLMFVYEESSSDKR
jgi:ribosomal protein S18 acetylase RimI-like enzyme